MCRSTLLHRPCDVRAILHTWSGGVHYENQGVHAHERPPRVLHIDEDQRVQFERLVKVNPKTGPLGCLVGVAGPEGNTESAADISDAFLNPHHIGMERRKIKRGVDSGANGDPSLAAIAEFDRQNPDFITRSQFGLVTVISCQTSWMASQFIKNYIEDEPINGSVNDAAHGWWSTPSSVLMTTSIYSPILSYWVPGMYSYSNGSSAEHWKCHFRAVMDGIAGRCREDDIKLTDEFFAGVSACQLATRNETYFFISTISAGYGF